MARTLGMPSGDYQDRHYIVINFLSRLGGQPLEVFRLISAIYEGRERLSGRPALDHLIETLLVAITSGALDHPEEIRMINAILTHDTPEEYLATLAWLASKISPLNASDSERLSKNGKKIWEYIADLLEEYVLTIVKLCDRIANLFDAEAFVTPKLEGYLQETRDYFLPMIDEALKRYPQYWDVLLSLKGEMERRLKYNEDVLLIRYLQKGSGNA